MKVTHIHAHSQLKNIKVELMKPPHKIQMEIVAQNMRLKRAEQMIRVINERG